MNSMIVSLLMDMRQTWIMSCLTVFFTRVKGEGKDNIQHGYQWEQTMECMHTLCTLVLSISWMKPMVPVVVVDLLHLLFLSDNFAYEWMIITFSLFMFIFSWCQLNLDFSLSHHLLFYRWHKKPSPSSTFPLTLPKVIAIQSAKTLKVQ